jgi:hypothetical protein
MPVLPTAFAPAGREHHLRRLRARIADLHAKPDTETQLLALHGAGISL